MSIESKLVLFILISNLFFLSAGIAGEVFGQNVATTATTPTPTTTLTTEGSNNGGGGVDPTVVTAAAGGGVAGVVAIAKQLLDQRKNTARDRTTDKDAGYMFALISKWIQLKKLYPHMTDKEILDLPISNNPYSSLNLGQAITAEADKWVTGNEQYWGISMPTMSVPTATTVEAVKGSSSASSTTPPAQLNTQQPQQQQKEDQK